MENNQKFNFIRDFTPIWFATILGFGGIALATNLIVRIFNIFWLSPINVFLVYFNFALFILLFSVWILKAIFYFNFLTGELKHPVIAGFHSLMPAATIMVAIVFSKLGEPFSLWQYQNISILFWIIGAAFEFILLTITIYFLITNEKMNINFINGGWLVPPVAALLTPIAGLKLVEFISNKALAINILWINYFFFGAGAFVFLLIAVALFSKIFFFERLNPKIFPSLWIILVPFSLMALSLSMFAKESSDYLFPEFKNALMAITFLVNPMLIGTGIWLLVLLIILTYYYLKRIELPYGVGWWAFVFPTASVSIASLNQAVIFKQAFFAYSGLGIYLFLIIITLIVLYRTIRGCLTKEFFKPVQ